MISPEEISVVVQGPILNDLTRNTCESIRRYLPGAEIVVSTWKGSDVSGLSCDVLVESKDPGNFTFVLPQVMDNGSDLYQMNINRQILSTANGVKCASRKYVCKLRSDSVFTGIGFLSIYERYNQPISEPYHSLLRHRVVTLSSVNPNRHFPFCFYLCDWFFFGLKEDVLAIWDIPLVEEGKLVKNTYDGRYHMKENFGNEQFLWLGFLRKCGGVEIKTGYDLNDKLLNQSQESYANCCIFTTAKQAGIYSQKVKNTGYGAPSWKSNAGLYTVTDWKKMYNQYCGGNLIAIHNPLEEIAYRGVQMIRRNKKRVWVRKLLENLK